MTHSAACVSDVRFKPPHFTGKERDQESGNDYFGARYYASSTGRFMSPDWSVNIMPVPYAKLGNPQSLNLYQYVGNNPVNRIDPDGHLDCTGKNANGIGCRFWAAWNIVHNGANPQTLNLWTPDKKASSSGGGVNSLLGAAAIQLPSLDTISRVTEIAGKGEDIKGTMHDKQIFSYWRTIHAGDEVKLQQDESGQRFADIDHLMIDLKKLALDEDELTYYYMSGAFHAASFLGGFMIAKAAEANLSQLELKIDQDLDALDYETAAYNQATHSVVINPQ